MASKPIQLNPAHKGLLHKELGVGKGMPIPASKLAAAKAAGGKEAKRAQFAINAKKFSHSR